MLSKRDPSARIDKRLHFHPHTCTILATSHVETIPLAGIISANGVAETEDPLVFFYFFFNQTESSSES